MGKFKTYIFILSLIAVSCNRKSGVDVYVTNARDVDIKKIEFFPSHEPLVLSNLKQNETAEVFMDFSNAPKIDGGYRIKINEGIDSLNRLDFGYYSNGSPSEKEIRVVIYNNSFSVKPAYKDY